MDTIFICQFCGSRNNLFIDPGGGDHQQFVEDCGTCCRPNVITLRRNTTTNEYDVDVYLEDRG